MLKLEIVMFESNGISSVVFPSIVQRLELKSVFIPYFMVHRFLTFAKIRSPTA